MRWELLWIDLRFAGRNALRRPGFTVLVVLTLALGIGVNSAVFALVDAVLLRTLPYRDPSRLVFMWQTLPRLHVAEAEATPFDIQAWKGLRTIPDIAMFQYGSYSLTGDDTPERVRGARVTAALMPTLGIAPSIGRAFAAAEDFDDAPAVAVLGDGLWRRRFGADSSVVGRSVQIDGTPHTIVGVMPPNAVLPGRDAADSEIWLPMRMTPVERAADQAHSYTFVGRLAPGASLSEATAEFETRAAQLAATLRSHKGTGGRLVPIAEQTSRGVRQALGVAAGSVALLLLVAAANASTLLIARASDRAPELAVRAALGATRGRLLSLSAAECALYASAAAAVGLAIGWWMLRLLVALFGKSFQAAGPVGIDARTAVFTAALAVVLGALFGAVAAFRPPAELAESLRGATRSTPSAAAGRARQALVVAQVALSVVLLACAGLMMSSVTKLSHVDVGFAADHLLTFRVGLNGPRYESAPARVAYANGLLARLSSAAGVQSAAAISVTPFGGMRNADSVVIEGRTPVAGEPPVVIDQRYATPGHFRTLKIPLLEGRLLSEADDSRTDRVIVINRAMARRYFPDGAVDRRVRFSGELVWFRIVGVVGDVRHISLTRDSVPEMYHALAQDAVPTFSVVVRTAADPSAIAPAARAATLAADPDVPMYEVMTMDERVASSFAQTRATMIVLLATALLAAALAAVAIYGSVWYAVVMRQKEIGIRLALGATRASVFGEIVGSAVARASVGAAIGALMALAAGRLLATMLFETRTSDPTVYGVVVALVLTGAAVAGVLPARRAIAIDPAAALRSE